MTSRSTAATPVSPADIKERKRKESEIEGGGCGCLGHFRAHVDLRQGGPVIEGLLADDDDHVEAPLEHAARERRHLVDTRVPKLGKASAFQLFHERNNPSFVPLGGGGAVP